MLLEYRTCSTDSINHKVVQAVSSNREFLWSSGEVNVKFMKLIFRME